MNPLQDLEKELNKPLPTTEFNVGDTIRVTFRVREGDKERTQNYEGVVIAIHGEGVRRTVKVRRVSFGVGVERTFPLASPRVSKIKVVRRGSVRRAKLYYLRDRIGKKGTVR